MAYPFNTGKY